jgi:hypothetical protein
MDLRPEAYRLYRQWLHSMDPGKPSSWGRERMCDARALRLALLDEERRHPGTWTPKQIADFHDELRELDHLLESEAA